MSDTLEQSTIDGPDVITGSKSELHLSQFEDIRVRSLQMSEIATEEIRQAAEQGLHREEFAAFVELVDMSRVVNFDSVGRLRHVSHACLMDAKAQLYDGSYYDQQTSAIEQSAADAKDLLRTTVDTIDIVAGSLIAQLHERRSSDAKKVQGLEDTYNARSDKFNEVLSDWPTFPLPSHLKPSEITAIQDMLLNRRVGVEAGSKIDIVPALSLGYINGIVGNLNSSRLEKGGPAYAIAVLFRERVGKILTFEEILRYLNLTKERCGDASKSNLSLPASALLSPIGLYEDVIRLMNAQSSTKLGLQCGWRTEIEFDLQKFGTQVGQETRRTRIYGVSNEAAGTRHENNACSARSIHGRVVDTWDD